MQHQLTRQTRLSTAASGCARTSKRSVSQAIRGVTRCPDVKLYRGKLRLQAASANLDNKQRADEARWEKQVLQGKVKNVACTDLPELMKDGWVLLDVRPPHETKKVPIIGAVEVPLFQEDGFDNISSIIKHSSSLGMGGWWIGGLHMVPNKEFFQQVQARIPKDARVIVGCQKGLRSLAACEQLARTGYNTLAWVNGGFETAPKGVLPTKDGQDIRYAGIGGVSAILGWTEVQQQEGAGVLGGAMGVIKLTAVILALDMLLFAYEYFKSQ